MKPGTPATVAPTTQKYGEFTCTIDVAPSGRATPMRTEVISLAVARSLAGIAACSCFVETNVVGRGAPFQRTVEPTVNAVPLTVSLNAGPPRTAETGLKLVGLSGPGSGVCCSKAPMSHRPTPSPSPSFGRGSPR